MESSDCRNNYTNPLNNQLDSNDYHLFNINVCHHNDYQRNNWHSMVDPFACSPMVSSSLIEGNDYPLASVNHNDTWDNTVFHQLNYRGYERDDYDGDDGQNSIAQEVSPPRTFGTLTSPDLATINNPFDEDESDSEKFDEDKLVIDTSSENCETNCGTICLADYNQPESCQVYDNQLRSCQVCGDKSTGRHYNAFTCEGCKGFFRRSVMKDMKYQCKSSTNDCPVNAANRRKCCRACRFKRCLEIGMNPAICLNKLNDDIMDGPAKTNSLENILSNITQVYRESLGLLMNDYGVMVLDKNESFSYSNRGYSSISGGNFLLHGYINLYLRLCTHLISFESNLQVFHSIPIQDQWSAICETGHSIVILFLIYHFNATTNQIIWPSGEMVNIDDLKGSIFSEIRFILFQLSQDFSLLCFSDGEMAKISLILLISSFEEKSQSVLNHCYQAGHFPWDMYKDIVSRIGSLAMAAKNLLNNLTCDLVQNHHQYHYHQNFFMNNRA